MTEPRFRICFVCMGNICRSPLAENIFRHKARQRRVDHLFEIDSAGTGGWHAGEPPDPRARHIASQRGVEMTGLARQFRREDFTHFDLIVCMDDENFDSLRAHGAPPSKVRLLLECDSRASCREVPDPYYGGPDGFANVFNMIDAACDALLDELLKSEDYRAGAPRVGQ